MTLISLAIQNLRNITDAKVQFSPRFNILWGVNGSGKTSFLEAIHYLSLGRSFRTRLHPRIINHEAEHFSLFTQIQQANAVVTVGLERHANGESRIRIDQENVRSALELTKLLPIQLLNTECRLLLTGNAKGRRQFIDWGAFHGEPEFYTYWHQAQRILKQRNAALRLGSAHSLIKLWDTELERMAAGLNQFRKAYVTQISPIFSKIIDEFLPNNSIGLVYKAGWNEEIGLLGVLEQSLSRDLQLGYTQYGPQRADLSVRFNNSVPAYEVLSHGQQKLLVYALRLAQGILLRQQSNKQCIYLLDDLPAELDSESRRRVASVLTKMEAQVFVTGVERTALSDLENLADTKVFHVERGSCFVVN